MNDFNLEFHTILNNKLTVYFLYYVVFSMFPSYIRNNILFLLDIDKYTHSGVEPPCFKLIKFNLMLQKTKLNHYCKICIGTLVRGHAIVIKCFCTSDSLGPLTLINSTGCDIFYIIRPWKFSLKNGLVSQVPRAFAAVLTATTSLSSRNVPPSPLIFKR